MKKLGFGLMRLPLNTPGNAADIDLAATQAMMDRFLRAGFTYFDTSYVYHGGASEAAFRETVVKRYPRGAFTITDKMPMFQIEREDQLWPIFSETLQHLGVDYLDYYWLHSLDKRTYKLSEELHAFRFVQQRLAEGSVRHIGFSFHDTADVLEEILKAHPEMEYVQLQLNYLDWESSTVQARKCYELCEAYGRKVIVMEPLKGGALANPPQPARELLQSAGPQMGMPEWGLRFAASHKNVVMVLSGMSTMEQVEENIRTMQQFQPLTQRQLALALEAGRLIRSSIAVPCTACRYCDGCPKDIAIPEYFALYNQLSRLEKRKDAAAQAYAQLAGSRGPASACIACGRCEQHCPQHIGIIQALRQVAQALETT